MRKGIIGALVALLLATLGVFAGAAPAQALPEVQCDINGATWINATDGSPTSWGRVRYCLGYDNTGSDQGWYPLFQVQDTLTDGYQVHLEFHDNFSTGPGHATGNGDGCAYVQSAGAVVSSCWDPANTWSYAGGQDLYMRLVKGRACCPHQAVAYWEWGDANHYWTVIVT